MEGLGGGQAGVVGQRDDDVAGRSRRQGGHREAEALRPRGQSGGATGTSAVQGPIGCCGPPKIDSVPDQLTESMSPSVTEPQPALPSTTVAGTPLPSIVGAESVMVTVSDGGWSGRHYR